MLSGVLMPLFKNKKMTIREKVEQALPLHIPFSAYGIAEIVYPNLRRKHPKGHFINTGEGDVKIVLAKLDYVEDLGDGMYCIEKIEL